MFCCRGSLMSNGGARLIGGGLEPLKSFNIQML